MPIFVGRAAKVNIEKICRWLKRDKSARKFARSMDYTASAE